jgi:hypothetical protein
MQHWALRNQEKRHSTGRGEQDTRHWWVCATLLHTLIDANQAALVSRPPPTIGISQVFLILHVVGCKSVFRRMLYVPTGRFVGGRVMGEQERYVNHDGFRHSTIYTGDSVAQGYDLRHIGGRSLPHLREVPILLAHAAAAARPCRFCARAHIEPKNHSTKTNTRL